MRCWCAAASTSLLWKVNMPELTIEMNLRFQLSCRSANRRLRTYREMFSESGRHMNCAFR
jgi:hypothetical protein